MLWAALTLTAGCAGWVAAAGGLKLRSPRLAVPVHAAGMALAFGGCGAGFLDLSERAATGGEHAETLLLCGLILAAFIFPLCLGSAMLSTLFLRRPLAATVLGISIPLSMLIPAVRPIVSPILLIAAGGAILVAPTWLVHEFIRRIPEDRMRDRFLAVASWTLFNSILVFACGQAAETAFTD